MGCATSKQRPICRNCQTLYSPARRSYSMHLHHHAPPQPQKGKTHHVVALTSTTLGSLELDPIDQNRHSNEDNAPIEDDQKMNGGNENDDRDKKIDEFSMGLIEAKTWSTMIEEKIHKVLPETPIFTPPGEPETMNEWEIMEGLDGITPLRPSFSFHVPPNQNPIPSNFEDPKSELQQNGDFSPNPTSNLNSNSNPISVISEFDHRGREKVVLYFTSLRGVRKTYEDCCNVREILKRLAAKVDARDVSMDSGFKEELKELLGEEGFSRGGGSLPRVFLGNKYIGGAEEIMRMHEEGRLKKAVESCEVVVDGGGDGCEACGDIRFVPCHTCSGSCKVYCEEDYSEDCGESEYGFQRCHECNENGIIRCPICCN